MNALQSVEDRSSPSISPTRSVPPYTSEDADAPTVEGYRIKATIGRGGMGIVYLAEDLALGREVALKVLPSDCLRDPRSIARFRREARALARIHHPNIVPIHSIGETRSTVWFAMGLVRGETLSAVIQAAATGATTRLQALFSESRDGTSPGSSSGSGTGADRAGFTIRIGRQLALGLHQVHEAGLVHRDVKPSNVLLDQQGDPVLVDFGVACDPQGERMPEGSRAPGTLRFMPPELLQAGSPDPDPRADIYALGVTLYELLTLSPAFGQEEPGSLIDAIVHGRFERPCHQDADVPRALEKVILRAMAADPEDRYPTGREFAEALGDASRDTTVRPTGGATIRRAWRVARRMKRTALLAGAALTLGFNAAVIFPSDRGSQVPVFDSHVLTATQATRAATSSSRLPDLAPAEERTENAKFEGTWETGDAGEPDEIAKKGAGGPVGE